MNDSSTKSKGNSDLMAEVRTPPVQLKWDVFVTPGIPSITADLPPGAKQRLWSPMSSTLISGKRDAVLVDTFITVEQASALADWVAASGKNVTTIYVPFWRDSHAPALLRHPT
jgi:hypothetical protein